MAINKDLLEVSSHDGPGYAPVVDFGAWRIALINQSDECAPGGVSQMERHNETDEVFVLLEGRAVLFVAEPADNDGDRRATIGRICPCAMEPSKLYNVRRSTWHTCVLARDAKVLVVENRDTTTANSSYIALGDSQRADLVRDAASLDD